MRGALLIASTTAGALLYPTTAMAQSDPHAGHRTAAAPQPQPAEAHAGHANVEATNTTAASAPDAAIDPHAGHSMPMQTNAAVPMTELQPAGSAPAPAPPLDHAADAVFGAEAMGAARDVLYSEIGDVPISTLRFDLAELQVRDGRNGYRWEGEAWYGNGIHRAQLNFEGEGEFGGSAEQIEFQLLYSRAIAPYFNAEVGVRYDIQPDPSRTYIVAGVEGIAPYWFEVSAQAFVSNRGELSARLEGSYDLRITQRLILQPRVELNLSAEDVPALRIGSGITDIEAGVRLRYEISPQFAPYVGYEYAAKVSGTADYARTMGDDPSVGNLVAGVRFWF